MKKNKLLLIIILLILVGVKITLFSNTESAKQEIATIQKEIDKLGFSWVAGETSLTRLSESERQMRHGTLPNDLVQTQIDDKIELLADVPPVLDWRNKSGNWVTPIRDQGQCGSCWAFATTGVLESMTKIAKKIKTDLDLSEQTLLSCSNAGDCDGGYTYYATKYCKTTGIPRESCFPYSHSDEACKPCNGWQKKTVRITSYRWYNKQSAKVIENALQAGPVTSFMEIYSDFYNYKSGIYQKTPSAKYKGGHAIVIIGYNVNENYWICKNSWGEDWGENGYFKIRMGNVRIASDCMSMSGPIMANNLPVLQTITAQNTYEGSTINLTLSATDTDSDPITYGCLNLPTGATLNAASGAFSWTPSYTQSGVYNLQFAASDGMGESVKTGKITVFNVKRKQF